MRKLPINTTSMNEYQKYMLKRFDKDPLANRHEFTKTYYIY